MYLLYMSKKTKHDNSQNRFLVNTAVCSITVDLINIPVDVSMDLCKLSYQ